MSDENKTGTYKLVDGKLTKVSDRVPNMRFMSCTCPRYGYYSEHLDTFVETRKHKRKLLDERGLEETG